MEIGPEARPSLKSFLLIRFSAIGDCVMAVPVASAVRASFPDAELVWAVESRCQAVIDTDRLVSWKMDFPRDRWKKNRFAPKTFREQLLAFTKLRKVGFEYGLDLQGHGKTALCLKLAKPKKALQVQATDPLSRHLNPIWEPPGPLHTVEKNLAALESLTGISTPEAHFAMPELVQERQKIASFRTGQPLATFSVSAGQPEKAWKAEYWSEVAKGLIERGFQVVVLGGPSDAPLNAHGTLDQVGKLNLADSMAAVASSSIHLCADTGSGHMAAAYGVPCVSVFGPTDPRTFRPYSQLGKVLKNSSDPNSVSPEEVLIAVDDLRSHALSH